MPDPSGLSDKALAVFAFAIYHQLESGEPVSAVVTRDGSGHRADPEAVRELEGRGLVSTDGDRMTLTPDAQAIVRALIDAMRQRLARGSNS